MPKIHPTYTEVCEHLEQAATSPFIRSESVGKSVEGRDIRLATVTDFDIDDDEKQVVVLTCGVHGSEESGRALGMAVLDWAQTDEAAETLRKQRILLFSCVNPDGAERNSYHNVQDINICRAYRRDGHCAAPEAQAVWDVLLREVPDIFVDCHGLAGGGMHEVTLPMLGRLHGSENLIAMTVANDMARAAEAAGFPQQTSFYVDAWTSGEDFIEKLLFDRFHTIGFTLEMNEGYFDWHECQKSGMARLRALFEYGNRPSFGLPFAGYPNGWLLGGSMGGLLPHGRNAGERRRNRAEVTPFLPQFARMNRRPDADAHATIDLVLEEGAVPIPHAFAFAARLYPGYKCRSVSLNANPLHEDAFPTGYRVHPGPAGPLCVVNIAGALNPGEHRLDISCAEEER